MDPATLNDIGITLAGLVGVAIFYVIGKKASDERNAKSKQQSIPQKPRKIDRSENPQ